MIEGGCHCGAVRWRYDSEPDGATACSCTVCRRYGVLWIYGHDGEDVHVMGPTKAYIRRDGGEIGFHFCAQCGCVVAWRAVAPNAEGRRRSAVNVRLAEPADVAAIPIDHLDGLDGFHELPRDGRTVGDMWF